MLRFRDSNGEYLDPKDFVNAESINENIDTSFEGLKMSQMTTMAMMTNFSLH